MSIKFIPTEMEKPEQVPELPEVTESLSQDNNSIPQGVCQLCGEHYTGWALKYPQYRLCDCGGEVNAVCEFCKSHDYIYRKEDMCVFNTLSKEHNPGGKLMRCSELKGEQNAN